MRRKILLQLLALLVLPTVAWLIYRAGDRPLPPPPPLKAGPRTGAAPEAGGIALPDKVKSGWKMRGQVVRYNQKTLFDRIDGAAPSYIRAGFQYSLGAEYQKPTFKEPVVVDVYDMGTTAQGLGMYATERDASYTFIEVGDEGYQASGSLNFWRGRFYAKLAGYEEGEEMDRGLMELARDLDRALPPAARKDEDLSPLALLPTEGRRPNSEGFSRQPLGEVQGLQAVFYAGYAVDKEQLRLFVVRTPAAAEAQARLQAALAYLEKDGAKVEEKNEQGLRVILARGSDVAHLLVQAGPVLAGGLDLPAAGPVLAGARAILTRSLKNKTSP